MAEAIQTKAVPPVGVDPRLVFKVKAAGRLTESNFASKGLQLLGESGGWGYFVLPADASASEFNVAIDAYGATEEGKTFFALVEDLEPYNRVDRAGFGVPPGLELLEFPLVVDVHLWPAAGGPEAKRRLADVRTIVGAGWLGSDDQPAFLLVRARVDRQALDRLLGLMVVERVRLPPTPFLSPTDWIESLVTDFVQPPARSGVVGIIDDGVHSTHALLDGLIEQFDVPSGRPWADRTQHGTMVAGLASYGDFESALRDGSSFPNPIRVIAARVVETSAVTGRVSYPTDEPEHKVIDEAVRKLVQRGARVINISIADVHGYSGPHVDERTEVLDQLCRELDVVIVVCSGNVAELPDGADLHTLHPDHLLDATARIAEPAIAVNVLTVGSIARSDQGAHGDGDSPPEMRAIAQADQVSPFSRSGPGFHEKGSVKPECVHFGGNTVTQASLSKRQLISTNVGSGAVSLAMPGPFRSGSGTSFAAPRVARVAAVVRAEYPEASANLTRALVGLSTRVPPPHQPKSNASAEAVTRDLRLAGFGQPDEVRAIDSVQNRVVMTFDGAIDVDTSVIHEIPVPIEFATGKSDRSISVALAFDPPTRRFRREYLAAKMRFDLYRAIELEELVRVMEKQPKDSGLKLPKNRQRVQTQLRPSSEAVLRSTLQVRRWRAADGRSMDPDDGDTYYLVVTHVSEPWAGRAVAEYETQRYAIAVELEDRGRQQINLLGQLQQRIDRVRART